MTGLHGYIGWSLSTSFAKRSRGQNILAISLQEVSDFEFLVKLIFLPIDKMFYLSGLNAFTDDETNITQKLEICFGKCQ